jgi:hypothetical protein
MQYNIYITPDGYSKHVRGEGAVCWAANVPLTYALPPELSFCGKCQFTFDKRFLSTKLPAYCVYGAQGF